MGHEAGLPAGVIAAVPGLGPAGAALGSHSDVDAITFTGSSEVAQPFLGYAGVSNMKVVSLECGGKSPHLVFPAAADLDETAHTVAASVFANAGQMCDAGSRLLIDRAVAPKRVARITALAGEWTPGGPRDPGTRVGAVIDPTQSARALGFVERAAHSGARLLIGGRPARPGSGGSYFAPTVLDDIHPAAEAAQEKILGPVLAVTTFNNDDEAIALANGTRYGLAAAVWTRDRSRAAEVASRIEAGSVFVNGYDRADLTVPSSGHRRSGIGVDRSLHALEKYSRLKTTWLQWNGAQPAAS